MNRHCLMALIALSSAAGADVTLPAIFGDGMVLQRNTQVAVWGRAEAGEEVSVRMGEEQHVTRAGDDGNWSVFLDPRPAGAPQTLTVEGQNTLVFSDVLFGEVWIGAGQSNMGLPVRCCRPVADDFKPRAGIRLYQQRSWHSAEPQWEGDGTWQATSEAVTREFSGALYYFGLELHEALEVPVGLIQISLGGTRIESWTSAEAQYTHPLLAPFARADDAAYRAYDLEAERAEFEARAHAWDLAHADATPKQIKRQRPRGSFEMHMRVGNVGGLFNGKVAPLIPFTIAGVLWYQGENNALKPELYQHQLTNLIRDWRKRWGLGDFPFAWVQLPNFAIPMKGEKWPEMRDAMRRTLSEPNTGMVIAIDIGQSRNIHPWNKRMVGKRFCDWALGTTQGRDVATSGPLYVSHEIEGARVTVQFDHTYGGLRCRGESILGFELSASDGVWHAARAELAGATVRVTSEQVPEPRDVRFNWSNDPACTLLGATKLPASPFTSVEPTAISGDNSASESPRGESTDQM